MASAAKRCLPPQAACTFGDRFAAPGSYSPRTARGRQHLFAGGDSGLPASRGQPVSEGLLLPESCHWRSDGLGALNDRYEAVTGNSPCGHEQQQPLQSRSTLAAC